jgi:hypothetical protein
VWNASTYPFPLEIEHVYDECITDLRPKFNKVNTYVKACELVDNMQKEFLTLISTEVTLVLDKDVVFSR